MRRTPEMPGEEPAAETKPGVTELSNTSLDPNEIARQHERRVRTIAAIAADGEPDLAPMPAIGTERAIAERTIGGQRVRVRIPSRRVNEQVLKFGPESPLPRGTPVRADGNPCEGDEEPYGVVGDIETSEGLLVNRVIPIADPESEVAA